MKVNKKNLNLVASLLILIFLFLVTRLVNLLTIPIFTDEAIYLRWSQIASYDASWRFISLVDGKQPLYMWITMSFMKFLADPLLAGRLVSVLSGLGSIIGLFLLTQELFNSKLTAFIASLLYIILPLTLFYDKLALVDSMLTMFGIWSLWLAVKMAKEPRLDYSLLLGGFLGAAYLTKSPAVFFLILSFLSLTFSPIFSPVDKKPFKHLLRFLFYFIVSFVISQAMYNILRLSPLMHMIAIKNSFFVRTFKEVLENPFVFFIGNLRGILGWLVGYFSWPLIVIAFIGLFFQFQKNLKEKIFLVFWFIGPLVSYGLFGKVLYPRYILVFSPALIMLIAHGFYGIHRFFKDNVKSLIISSLFIIPSVLLSFTIVYKPMMAKIPQADRGQFFDSQFAGGGIIEAVDYFKKKSREGTITLYTEGTFGLLPYAIELYFYDNPNMKIVGVWPLKDIPSKEVVWEEGRENYIITNETQKIPPDWPIEKIFEIRKGKSDRFLRLFKILPNNEA